MTPGRLVLLPQLALEDLAARVLGERLAEEHLFRHFEASQLILAVRDQRGGVERLTRFDDDDRRNRLDPLRSHILPVRWYS